MGLGGRPRAGGGYGGLAEWGSRGAGGRPCSRLSLLCAVRACVCVCQAVPILPVRTGCEPVDPCRVLVPGGAGWCLQGRLEGKQGPASPWDITMVTLWPPARLLHHVCAGRGCGGACPFLPAGMSGTHVRVCVFVHEGYYLMSILALSTH